MSLPPNHFLALPRATFPDFRDQTYDTATVAAADYDVDVRTGFMPPRPPVARLDGDFEVWERTLDEALGKVKLAAGEVRSEEAAYAERWREIVRKMPILDSTPLNLDELLLRRGHLVLVFIMHIYVHSSPPNPRVQSPITIPAPISVPLVKVSKQLGITPIMTYADTVPWNWKLIDPSLPVSTSNIQSNTLLSGTPDENAFYMTSAKIELRGVEALTLMRESLNEAFLADRLALKRITAYLNKLAKVIDELTEILMKVREECDPGVFYNSIRPWFNGGTSNPGGGWTFEGVDALEAELFRFLGGPSAGQSSLIHALDLFLGVDHATPASENSHPPSSTSDDRTFLARQEQYMPRHHRAFLHHLRAREFPIRQLLSSPYNTPSVPSATPEYTSAYNEAVLALKRFRDGHIRIATLYIVSQARKVPPKEGEETEVRGTGGTSLVRFLKGARDETIRTLVP